MSLKPWREVAVPHEDVLRGTFQQAEFAADISRVHDGTATAEYQDPDLFFKRTFITEGMRLLLDSVVKRLSGRGGDPVIQLQTAFGGGKTHTILAVYHIAKGEIVARNLQGIASILDNAQIKDLPKAKVAVLDGIKMSPNHSKKRGGVVVNTLWGELAWQLGGDEGYELVKNADTSGTSPGKEILIKLISTYAPCAILIDELVAYIRQFEEGKSFAGGTFDSNLSFLQALTEAMKAVPNAVLLASLPESDKEAGSQRGINALHSLEHYFARVQAIWKPVATEEAFEIVRRRLFTSINDKSSVEAVCRAYADEYIANGAEFPQETQESRYYDRLVEAYPIHPEVFDRLYSDWSTLDNFQRTRGVLKFMAKVIHRLWSDGNKDYLIQPGNIPLYDADVRNEAIYYLPQGWDPVLEEDIDGERAETTSIEKFDTRFGSVQACRRVARTIFLGSAPSNSSQRVRGVDTLHVVLGCIQPGQQVGLYKDALKRLVDTLHYLNSSSDRFWFDTRTNLRREMEERKRRFIEKEKEEVFPVIRNQLQRALGQGTFGGVHVFTGSSDIPDDWSLRLVVLPPDASFGKTVNNAVERAQEILRSRGEQPRQKQNRLIFLAADNDTISRLKDQVRTMLAWQSIVDDVAEMKLNLDQLQTRQAKKYLEEAGDAIRRMIREAYKWVLAPMQEDRNGKGLSDIQWEHFQVNPGAANFSVEIERVLRENELLISEWAPIHLAALLKRWFWKSDAKEVGAMDVWQKMCCYLYLPRLRDDGVFRNALIAGAGTKDFFGFAYGKDGTKFVGFVFGAGGSPILDGSLLLVEPSSAAKYAAEYEKPQEVLQPTGGVAEPTKGLDGSKISTGQAPVGRGSVLKKRFYGTVELDPVRAKYEFARIVDEIIQHFVIKPDAKMKISIEVQAESANGFDEKIQRVVKENSNVLRFKNAEFEKS
ncbi:MAG: DUF499 domain-containing protein [Candidatus Omnitrophota bacterium]|nr:DUF499 domain-containing protein [Candidatus Omnitrophota bacterium]